ncbi:unnamed protein product [Ambrosiozyma monospora]|uniref:Unnamed protein product n=1 Tax=Ambrosiozyma monospora TaxID=43982 RepID=A0ACB5T7X0_AMBMO|nr:unnamed protein product [Ambrosiozyma monospora]
MERVKVLYQVQGSSASYNKGTMATVYQIFKEEGYKGLFRGNGINCIRIVPYTAVQYSVYQEMKKWLGTNEEGNLSVGNKLIAGSVCGLASVLVTYSMDLVKTRLSIQTAKSLTLNKKSSTSSAGSATAEPKKPMGMFKNVAHIYKYEGGFRALYRGLAPTSLGVAPYVALNFAIYEKLTELFPKEWRSNPMVTLSAGALSGGIGQTLIYPMDILRRRFQVATLSDGAMGFKYNSTWHALVTIVKVEGYKGLYKGWTANMWKIMPSMAVQWASYDFIKNGLQSL